MDHPVTENFFGERKNLHLVNRSWNFSIQGGRVKIGWTHNYRLKVSRSRSNYWKQKRDQVSSVTCINPNISTSSPTFMVPCSTQPVTTVPQPWTKHDKNYSWSHHYIIQNIIFYSCLKKQISAIINSLQEKSCTKLFIKSKNIHWLGDLRLNRSWVAYFPI